MSKPSLVREKRIMAEQQENILSSTRRPDSNIGTRPPPGDNVPENNNSTVIAGAGVNDESMLEHPSFFSHRDPSICWQETPFGVGRHSQRPEQSPNTSPILNPSVVSLSSVLERIIEDVESFGIDLIKSENWIASVDPKYQALHLELSQFQKRCLTEHELELVERVEDTLKLLSRYKDGLDKRAETEKEKQHRPVLKASVLNSNVVIQNNVDAGSCEPPTGGSSSNPLGATPPLVGQCNVENHADLLSRIPELVDGMEKIMDLEDIDEILDTIERFNKRFGDESNVKEIVETVLSMENKFESFMREMRSEIHGLKTSVDVQRITTVESKVVSLERFTKQVDTSLKVATQWISTINDSINTNPAPRLSLNLNTTGVPTYNGRNPVRNTDVQARDPNDQQSRSCPISPTNIPPRNLESELRQVSENLRRSDSVVSLASNLDVSVAKVHERRLTRIISEIKSLISEDITSSSITDDVIMDLYTNVASDVLRLAKECDDKCLSYAKLPNASDSLIESAGETSACGYSWVSQVKKLYRDRQLHLNSSTNKAFTGTLNLKKFSGDSNETIYEFFKKFDQFTKSNFTLEQKAMLLYSSYLDDKIKQELVLYSTDFQAMKQWLIKKYGKIKSIVDGKLLLLKERAHPGPGASSSKVADYCRFAHSILAGIQSLPQTSDIPIEDLSLYTYTHDSLTKICQHLPSDIVENYLHKLRKNDLDPDFFQGKKAFDLLMELLLIEYTDKGIAAKIISSDRLPVNQGRQRRNSGGSTSSKKVHSINVDAGPVAGSSKTQHAVHHQKNGKSSPKGKVDKWYNSSYKFPCPISDHTHEIGTCTEFFSKPASKRKFLMFRKCCLTCLGPKDRCQSHCSNHKRIPSRLICQECIVTAKSLKKSPYNVLICPKREHSKVNLDDLLKDCEKWFPSFSAKDMSSSFPSSVNIVAFTARCMTCSSKASACFCEGAPSYSSPVDPDAEVPCIDTSTGELVDVDDCDVVRESTEEAFYIMQMFDLRGQDCLAFFDPGANQHLVDGGFAEKINLKVINPKSTPIGVAGGGRIWTEYGMYALMIGPTIDGKYHEIKCQGIKSITTEFPLYELAPISAEVRKTGKLRSDIPLPKCIGGSRAHLLLGIKNTSLIPSMEFMLPCGLAVYMSQIKDKWNSRICYGGPHSLFTEVNSKLGGNFNHVTVFFSEMINKYRNSLYPILSGASELDFLDDSDLPICSLKEKSNVYTMKASSELDIVVYPTPLTADDTKIFDVQEVDEVIDLDDTEPKSEDYLATEDGLVTGMHFCSAYKAKIPLDKLIKMVDDEDIDNIVNYRCPQCSKCVKCSQSNRTKTMSLQESMEQDIISRSVSLDMEAQKVWVELPFTKDPVKFLTDFHKGQSNNHYQAIRAYKTQCRKPLHVKEGIRKAQKELVDKGFMVKLSDLSSSQQELIKASKFQHYYPWSSVEKDSISTPVRLVVDPSRTGLNMILAKGENNMAKIHEILIRNRCRRHIFTSDISKLYNQLHLKDSALPYSLFLFSDELDMDLEPTTYVLVRAWYGVRSTGNQSGEALESLASTNAEEFPLASDVLLTDRYVDDLLSGANSKEIRDQQVAEIQSVLKQGGFKLKYVAVSGESPHEEASGDGETLKILGYKWNAKDDILSPGFQELNFNERKRGMKLPNQFPVVSKDDVTKLMDSTRISRRVCASAMATFFDPVGIWEPFKLQLKLDMALLNGTDWDIELPDELQSHWQERFNQFLEIPKMAVNRCVIPIDAVNPDDVRLLCLSDAAVCAGGAVIYASYKLRDGSYSCQLLTSKSKLLDMSIPRNELSAILLMAELAFITKKSLGSAVSEVLYFTDSTIALSWCHNVNKKLRMFVHNRVSTIRRFIEWTVGECEVLPLYHIDGTINIADLLTKEHKITPAMLGPSSEWISGKPWMKLDIGSMPVTSYAELSVSENDSKEIGTECFIEFEDTMDRSTPRSGLDPDLKRKETILHLECTDNEVTHCFSCPKSVNVSSPPDRCYGISHLNHCSDCTCLIFHTSSVFVAGRVLPHEKPLVPIVSLGWRKAVSIMTVVMKFTSILVHKTHQKMKNISRQESLQSKCKVCKFIQQKCVVDGVRVTREKEQITTEKFISDENAWLGESYWYRKASLELEKVEKKQKLQETYSYNDGIYFYTGRLSEEFPVVTADLDINVFFDNSEFKSIVPVVLSSSDVFFAYLIYVHDHVRPHSGIEITYREISKKLHVLKNPRRVIAKVRNDCVKCRLIFRKTLELEMANHGPSRTILAPPFHSVQMDIAYKFRARAWKNARQQFDIYALVIVCLLTSATSILVLEGLQTQDIIQALERHSSRFGIPSNVYVDNGSQLVALQNAKLQLRDVDLVLHDNLGLSVKVSAPKSHEERGRVEAKIKVIRSMLNKLSIKCTDAVTTISWETIFAKIANEIDNIPICKGNSSNVRDFGFDIITPNRYKLGRNNQRAIDDSLVLEGNTYVEVLEVCRKYQQVWLQIMLDRLHHFMPKPLKWSKTDQVDVGDLVIFILKDSGSERMWQWKLGRVTDVLDRKVEIEYYGPKGRRMPTITRCPRQVSKVYSHTELPVNTTEYYKKNVLKL